MAVPERSVALLAAGAQNWAHLDRGIPRYVVEHLRALLALAPEAIGSIEVSAEAPVTSNLNWLLGSGLVRQASDQRPVGRRRPDVLPAIYHVMSPFESSSLEHMWPTWARDPAVATVVTMYDLIPLVFAEHYLARPRARVPYRARAEMLRHVDGVLAISQTTADDIVHRLGIERERVHVIHAGATDTFGAMYESGDDARQVVSEQLPEVRQGFMLYVGGFEFRKNLERLIEAHSLIDPEVRGRHQLVIACKLLDSERDHLRRLAESHGLRSDDLVLTGFVPDALLGALYHACTLFVFPSLYEGSGLPILEAMSCGAPVAVSATSTGPEIVGDTRATFDPAVPAAIASCLQDTVSSPDVLAELAARSRERVVQYTWERTARETIRAYEKVMEAHPRRAAARRRRRLALVTPWPPDRSGIANYNLRVAEKLGRHVDVEIVAGRPASEYHVPQEHGVTLIGAQEFAAARSVLRPDRVLYCMGNSAFHGYTYDLLRRFPGAVLFHDVRLTGFYGWYSGTELPENPVGRFGGWFDSFYRGRMPDQIKESVPSWETQFQLGIYMTLDVQRWAQQCFVHSEFGRTVLELDRGPMGPTPPITVVPFGMPEYPPRTPDETRPLVISLGVVSEVKGIATLIDGFGSLAATHPDARLVIAGPAESHELERWRAYAREHAPRANIEIPGEVSAERFKELLSVASIAVQLRLTTNGEASAAVGDCLAAGIPTLVTDLGWLGDLPDTAVGKLALGAGPEELARKMAEILDDSSRAAALSAEALSVAADSSFERVAEAYLEALEL